MLDPAPTGIEGVCGQPDHVEGTRHGDGVGELFGGGGLEPGEPIHRDDLHRVAPGFVARGEPRFERVLGAGLDHVQQARRTGAIRDGGQVDDHGDVLVTAAGVAPHVLIHPDHSDTLETALIVDQHPLALGHDRVVRGVPRDPQTRGDPRHRQVLAHDPLKSPPQPAPRQPRPRLGRLARTLTPHVSTPRAPVPANHHLQHGRPPADRLVRQAPHHGVTRLTLTTAPATPLIRIADPARQHRTVRLKTLPSDHQAKLIHTAQRGHIGTAEGNARHAEVFWTGGAGTPIIRGPRPTPPQDTPPTPTPSTVKSPFREGGFGGSGRTGLHTLRVRGLIDDGSVSSPSSCRVPVLVGKEHPPACGRRRRGGAPVDGSLLRYRAPLQRINEGAAARRPRLRPSARASLWRRTRIGAPRCRAPARGARAGTDSR